MNARISFERLRAHISLTSGSERTGKVPRQTSQTNGAKEWCRRTPRTQPGVTGIMTAMTPPDARPMPLVGDKQDKAADVQRMFADIAPRYDLLNRVLSLGVDRSWRRAAATEALLLGPARLLDVATGTGDFAIELKTRRPQTEIVASDFVPQMLEIGERKRPAGFGKPFRHFTAQSLRRACHHHNFHAAMPFHSFRAADGPAPRRRSSCGSTAVRKR